MQNIAQPVSVVLALLTARDATQDVRNAEPNLRAVWSPYFKAKPVVPTAKPREMKV
jgi:hypothetical protein